MLYAAASPRRSAHPLRKRKDASAAPVRPKCCSRSRARRARKLRPPDRLGDRRKPARSLRVAMKLLTFQRLMTALALLGAVTLVSARVNAEEIDFGQINKFESGDRDSSI